MYQLFEDDVSNLFLGGLFASLDIRIEEQRRSRRQHRRLNFIGSRAGSRSGVRSIEGREGVAVDDERGVFRVDITHAPVDGV